jgi:cysteine synthase A
MLVNNILDLIGNTPTMRIGEEKIFAKAEFLNPGGSIKDRVALAMIDGAIKSGELIAGDTIVEPTSGNTGIGIALVGRMKNFKVKIVMPENMSSERKKLICSLGAELVLTAAKHNIKGAVDRAEEIARNSDNVFVPQQFQNPLNPKVHYDQTAQEIWDQLKGDISCFVAGVGSGGTLQGIGTFLKEKDPQIRIIAAEPKNVSALLGHEPGLHQIQGIGDGFVPDILDRSLIDDVVEVSDEDAIETTRQLSRDFGLLVGISSGANVWACRKVSSGIEGNVATVLADRSERYFSTALM